jgi:glycosyltransferase involved in cell wall biosynthesis
MSKPLIATDVPGCRQVVDDEVNGFLCRPRDARSLADAMLRLLSLSPPDLLRMGRAARARAESTFDERIVTRLYLAAIDEALR